MLYHADQCYHGGFRSSLAYRGPCALSSSLCTVLLHSRLDTLHFTLEATSLPPLMGLAVHLTKSGMLAILAIPHIRSSSPLAYLSALPHGESKVLNPCHCIPADGPHSAMHMRA